MIKLYDTQTGALIGTITEDQLQILIDQMEEESLEDKDYAITTMIIAYLDGIGSDPDLVAMLQKALGGREEITVRWERE